VGIGTDLVSASAKLFYPWGNVGIGSLTPGKSLDVQGTVRASYFVGDGSQLSNVTGGGWTPSGNDAYKASNGNVGIGTTLTTTSA